MSLKYYDITMEISPDTIVFPGDPGVEINESASISKGDVCNVSLLKFGSHTGTHMDAPKHFYDNGNTIDKLKLDYFYGAVKVFEIPNVTEITVNNLEALDINEGDRIILKTRNSELLKEKEFKTDFTYITGEAAEYLVKKKIRTIGVDYLSVEQFGSENFEAHYALLENNIAIIEGLYLADIKPGNYTLIALPLKIVGGNGSPTRAVLID